MGFSRFLYDHSPVLFQNALLSAYGYHLRRLRYGRNFTVYSRILDASQQFSADQLRSYQSERLAELLNHAYQYVPHYRTQMDVASVKPHDITLENIKRYFPILSKSNLRDAPERFQSTFYGRRQLTKIHTSGTTGTPLSIVATKSAIQQNYAFFARFLNWAGVSVGEPSATFAGRIIIPLNQPHPPYWRMNHALHNVLFSSYHISDKTIPSYIRALEHLNPRFIDAYPSAIYTIARYINDHGITHGIQPRAIVTSSETLQSFQRAAIVQAFRCQVFDQYGSAEMATFISQCEEGSYHVNPEYGLLELVDEQGNQVAPGEAGELVCTGFLNTAMPLIRYQIGDSAVSSNKSCKCGRQFPVVESLLGRTDDLILTPEGRFVGRLDPVFKGLGSIRESQIIQESLTRIVVRIVREPDYTEQVGHALVAALRERLGNVDLVLEYVDAIPRTSAGKFRSVISMVSMP